MGFSVEFIFSRIDYESMVLAGPETTDTTYINGINMGRCNTDTLTG